MPEFVKDVEELRQRALRRLEEGPVTEAYGLDKNRTIAILNEALATEIVCVLRYMHHYFMATGVHGKSVADEFKEHADNEREHADAIAERIQQLGGKPDFNPASLLQRSVSQYVEGESLADMIREDLVAERVVIDVYREMIRYFGEKDPTSRVLLEDILKDEEEHAADLTDMLYIVDPGTGETRGEDPGTRALSMRGEMESGAKPAERRGGERRVAAGAREEERRVALAERRTGAVRPEFTRTTGRGELIPERQMTEEFAGRGAAVTPAHEAGTSGRPQRPRPQQTEEAEVDQDVDVGAHRGGTRAVRVTKPNRKKRVA